MVEQPAPNHNGGQLAIGPDGYLYIGLGDGGGGGDPLGHGQDTATLLGSILRIDPEGATEDGPPLRHPAGQPLRRRRGRGPRDLELRHPEPVAVQLRHATGDLWVADVGQEGHEEIDRLPANGGFDAGRGANLGWAEMEGTHPFQGGENPAGAVLPIFEYGRDAGCSVIGGRVPGGSDPHAPGHVPLHRLLRSRGSGPPGRR